MEHTSGKNHDRAPGETGSEGSTEAVRELRFHPDVKFVSRNFAPEIAQILYVVQETAPETRDNTIWVTRAWAEENRGTHAAGEAFDIRIKNVVGFNIVTFQYCKEVEAWVYRIREQLGSDYDVVYGNSKHMNHMHIEYDPKKSSIGLNAHRFAKLILGE